MIPGLNDIFKANPAPQFKNLGDLLSGLLNIILFAAAFVAFFYILWGAFSYITAQGKKEDLAKARSRITWAIIGLIVVFLAFIISRFIAEVFKPKGGLPF
ncbi:hypothetical protein HYU45_00855 [Candidatus Daviesbacteria bacterium]|nr:hypothetical protein [Candidatus Daviesbacteria bacterium]